MKSLLHCLWTGPSFPYGLRLFIKKWVQYLRKSHSDFQLVVWLTTDSYNAASDYLSNGAGNALDQTGWSRCLPGVSVLFNRASLNYNSFYIALCNPLLAHYPETLQGIFKMLHAGKRFTAVSNIGRLLVLNACGGIYTDVDFLTPNYARKFPKNIDAIIKLFGNSSRINFYLPATNLNGYFLIENQAAVLSPKNIGALTRLLRNMSRCMASNFEEIYLETANNAEYLKNQENRRLEGSMFTSGLHKRLMEAFRSRDFDEFNRINHEIFKFESSKGFLLDSFGLLEEEPMLLEKGMRHRSYEVSGRLTYGVVVEFFEAYLASINAEKYTLKYWNKFRDLFAAKSLDDQFQFIDRAGERQGMYSWANPGYSRLNKLESAVNLVKQKFRGKHQMIKKSLLHEMVYGALDVKFGRFEAKISKQNRDLSLRLLLDVLKKRDRIYLKPDEAKELLKKFLVIAFVRIGIGGKTNMGNYVVRVINEPHYSDLKVLVDPEKKVLNYEDLEAAAVIGRRG